MYLKKLSIIYLSIALAASFSLSAFADIYSDYNPFSGGNSSGKIYAADPRYGEVNYIGHGYPGQNSETLKENEFHGNNDLQMEIDVRSTSNDYYGQTDIYVGSYGSGVLTSNSDSFSTGELNEYSHVNVFVEDYETPSGTSNITNADFNVNTSLIAANVSSSSSGGSTLNVNSSEFYGTTDLNADTINIENSTVVQQVGSSSDTQTIISQNTTLINNSNTLNSSIDKLIVNLMAVRSYLTSDYYSADSSNRTLTFNHNSASFSYQMPAFTYNTYSVVDQHINKSSITAYGTLPRLINYKFNAFESLFYAYAELFNNWYYPLRVTTPVYWRTYNLDTDSEESVNLARVFYDISWYTAKTYETVTDFMSDFNTYKSEWFSRFNSFMTDWFAKFDLYAAAFAAYVSQWNWFANKLVIMSDNISNYRQSDTQDTISLGTHFGSDVSYILHPYQLQRLAWDGTDVVTNDTTVYGNFRAMMADRLFSIISPLRFYIDYYLDEWSYLASRLYIMSDQLGSWRRVDNIEDRIVDLGYHFRRNISYPMSGFSVQVPYFDSDGKVQYRVDQYYGTFRAAMTGRMNEITGMLYFFIKNYFDNGLASNISNSVSSLNNNLIAYQNAEQNLQNKVTSSIQSFIPDLSLLGGFVAISWVSNYLQQCYISLGSFGTVIMIGLLLGVCMQFIGYFRYKY